MNEKYNSLEVIKISGRDNGKRKRVLCKCDCGSIKEYDYYKVKTGHTKSCGCLKNSLIAEARTKHGGRYSQLYKKWCGMKRRCYNTHEKSYKNYGSKGMGICEEWLNDFSSFENWAYNNGYREGLTIERIDVHKGYSPDNCTWIPMKKQARNKTNTVYMLYKGELLPIAEIAEIENISYKTLSSRYYRYKKRNPDKSEIDFDMSIPR